MTATTPKPRTRQRAQTVADVLPALATIRACGESMYWLKERPAISWQRAVVPRVEGDTLAFSFKDVATLCAFSTERAARRVFQRNKAEFTPDEVIGVNLTPVPGRRAYSAMHLTPLGLYHFAMLCGTEVGPRFRAWVVETFLRPHLSGARMVAREDFDALRLQVASLVSERDALRDERGNARTDLRLALEANSNMSRLASQIMTVRKAEVRHEREVELFVERPNLFAGAPLTEIDERVIAALHLHGPFDSVAALAKHLRMGVARLGDSISTLAARKAIRRSEGKIALAPQMIAPSSN